MAKRKRGEKISEKPKDPGFALSENISNGTIHVCLCNPIFLEANPTTSEFTTTTPAL
jgi:hypothetical protein